MPLFIAAIRAILSLPFWAVNPANGSDLRSQHSCNRALPRGRARLLVRVQRNRAGRCFRSALRLGVRGRHCTSFAVIPLIFDRDDVGLGFGTVLATCSILVIASAVLGGGFVLHGSPQFALGALLGAGMGSVLAYWALGEDRKKRGVPRRR